MTDRSFESMNPGPYSLAVSDALSPEREEAATPARFFFSSNCFAFAVSQFFRKGGFLIVSKSEWGWWPHLMWSPDMRTVYQFEPTEKKRRRLFPPMLYRGYIKKTRL